MSRYPAPQAGSHELHLSGGGRLTDAVGTGAPDQYAYVGGTGQYRGDPALGSSVDWSEPAADGQRLAYTSEPMRHDLVTLGTASLDLWLSSTAPDTDLQAVLTEVRPDGQEVYVQAGYRRASHRALDPARSTPTRPFHTHQAGDTEPLIPGTPTAVRLEIVPFAHVFRAQSRVRVWIDAPPRTSGQWGFDSLPGPSLNQIHHDPLHPSVLRLATLPGQAAPVGLPECGAVLRQPCRSVG